MAFDRQKFKQLVHYIVWKAGNRPGFGATKLNKVLWHADTRTYALTGKPLTGATYIREKYGPVPKQFMPVRSELESEHKITVIEPRGQYENTQFRALENPDAGFLSEKERQEVDYWIEHIDKDHTADSISELTHDYPWEIARMGEEIPYYAQFAKRIRAPKGDELEWAKSVVEKLKLS